MSSFNETVSIDSMQHGVGSVGTTSEVLDGSINKKAGKGVTIKNTHASQILYVGRDRVSATDGFALATREEMTLEIDDPSTLYVIGSGASTTYTWISY